MAPSELGVSIQRVDVRVLRYARSKFTELNAWVAGPLIATIPRHQRNSG